MSAVPASSIEQTQALYQATLGKATRLTASPEEVKKLLAAGQTPVVVELPWGQVVNGVSHDRHQLIPTRVAGQRLYFINALKTAAAPGSEIDGPGKGPKRRLEANGEESMALSSFLTLFGRGGKALLPI